MDDSAHLALNDGSPTYSSHSYHTEEALDVSIVSSDIFPFCKWTVLQDIGSDHLPILVELKWKQMTQLVKKNFWNFKKANWEKFRDTVDLGLLSKPPFECRSIDDLDVSPGFLSRKSSSRLLVKLYLGEITNDPLHFLCINLHCFNPC
ncbi:RNA-directed DNA polymerase from mobile element jockey [Trichonephila clavipes]|nr:RNA-directed DNA polymerase from mobile element jockey [Trichonephila clavipes]